MNAKALIHIIKNSLYRSLFTTI